MAAIALGGEHTLALLKDGTVVVWGDLNDVPTSPYETAVSGAVSYDSVTKTATFTPSSPLSQNVTLNAVVNTGTRSAAGAHPAADTSWSFSVPIYGPTYPPPGGVTRTDTGAEGAIGRSGGMTWTFDNVALAATNPTWWGPAANEIKISFDGSTYTGNEIHTYQAAQSNLPNGIAVWTGQTSVQGIPIYTRFTLTLKKTDNTPLALTTATNYGLAASVGAIVPVTYGQAFKANFIFEAATSPAGPFQPAYNLFDTYHSAYSLNYSVYSSFTAGFYYKNDAPSVAGSADLVIQKGGSGTYLFTLADSDNGTGSLAISATSSNQTLIPNANLVLGGSGADRSLTVTAAAGLTGSAQVTISISDGISTTTKVVNVLVNSPPQLTANNQLLADRGASAAVTSAVLQSTDAESTTAQIVYTLAAGGGNGGPPHEGTLKLAGADLAPSATFTQKDIDDGRLQYVHNGNCSLNDDFQFSVKDSQGASIPTGTYTSYSFRIAINHPNRLPVAVNGSAGASMGRPLTGTLAATNDDCTPQSLTFRILANPSKGTVEITNASTGAFTYTPNAGANGSDSFLFQVNDGLADAAAPGTFFINIANQAPVPVAVTSTTAENTTLAGILTATDYDLPAQQLTYAVATNGSKGVATIVDPAAGTFTYTPNDGAFGTDTFTFTASDGLLTSAPATCTVNIHPQLKSGRILVTNGQTQTSGGSIAIYDPTTHQQGTFASGGQLSNPRGIALEANGNLVVVDENNGVLRVDRFTGDQSSVVAPGVFSMPIGIAVERSGELLVGTTAGLYRVNPGTGAADTIFSGNQIDFPAGVRVSANGDILVTDVGAFAGKPSQVLRIDPETGAQTVISDGGNLAVPADLALLDDGRIVVADGPMGTNNVIAINPTSGAQQILTAGGSIAAPSGITYAGGKVLVASAGNASVVSVDPTTGAQAVLTSGGAITNPFGIAVVALDETAPVTSPVPGEGTYSSAQSVALSCNDGTGSGCVTTMYCLGTGCTPGTAYKDPIVMSASGVIRFFSSDKAGNAEGIRSATYTIIYPPTISGTPATGVTAGNLFSFTPTATNAVSFTITGKPSWATFDSATGTLSGIPTNSNAGTYPGIVISASNSSGSASLSAFTITVSTAAVNGSCGSAHGSVVSSVPAANLCTDGTPSAVSGSGPWSWRCSGLYGGATGYCSATKLASTIPAVVTGLPTGDYTGGKEGTAFTVKRTDGTGTAVTAYTGTATRFTETTALKPNTIYKYSVSSDNDPSQTVFMTVRTPLYNGWNIIAVPYDTTGVAPATLFGNSVSSVYQWVPTGATAESSNTVLGSYSIAASLQPGNGYFVKTSSGATTLAYNGTSAPQSVNVTLKPGWTMVANPNSTVKSDIAINWLIDGAALGNAVISNKIGGGIYWWNGTTYDSWSIVSGNPQVEPWKGYWILNLDTVNHVLTIK
ncbi:cadherin-like domain-containing protein [Geomonas oryzisoli]|uniref:cadherin-like domain-containing protein n=1 Tax=Geomonas oryzisoli TaxID=2847992 RepID=UPI001EEFF168|nr:Ig-like domain-containing protein [Geomonas oryzisoli]